MVLAGRGWLVSTSRAARDTRGAYARLLLLSGIAAVAWLAGGFGVAHADTSPETGGLVSRVMGAGDTAEYTGRAAGPREPVLTNAAARAASTTSTLTDAVVPQAAALPAHALDDTGVTEALDDTAAGAATHRVVGDTARAVDGTARGAGDLVSGVARASRGVVESTDGSLREGGLVDTVAEGLTDTTGGGVGDTVRRTVSVDLPVLGADGEPATGPEGVGRIAPDAARDRDEDPAADPGTAAPVVSPETVWTAAATASADAETGGDDVSAERVHLIAGGAPHSAGTDATGASAPSFPTPGAAGFLMARAVHTAPQAQRVALPGDPTLVVRDAADDPSYSPD
ncbi:hypothetical protein AB0I72_09205 [Nocardiopsis sp. NPDC049922]|uniref:hypothetical protein n=1 Tax=Nocardiopsis sp. NPDC049922 TaxID=3155157 RepID=UPI0033C769ED